jgi:HlyD family secretion protein
MKRAIIALVLLALAGGGGYAYYKYRKKAPEPTVMTAAVTRGDIADTVGATGTLQAVTTVQVGTQVSGTIQELHADFNSLVKKDQVIARLDPSLFATQIEQGRANLIRAQADLERLKVSLDDARTKQKRAHELSDRQLIPQSELDTADVNTRSIEAQIRSSQAQVTQAEASLNQNQVNLEHTVIRAPIDGLVISRNVDVGQTVAASMQAPTLFVLAADLTKMQVVANLDESDVGRIRPGQHVTFRVDAYPAEDFVGAVAQVRLQPIVQQNVVTYATVIDVPNPELKLKPGMTANVNVEIARRTDVVRVPNAALRFRPTPEIFAALNLPAPQLGQPGWSGEGRGRGGQGSQGAQGARGAQGAPSAQSAQSPQAARGARNQGAERGRGAQGAQGGQNAPSARSGEGGEAAPITPRAPGEPGASGFGRGGDSARMAERMQNMTPEQREQMMARMRERGGDNGGNFGGRRGQGSPAAAPPAQRPAGRASATTIDALFGPLPQVESRGQVWVWSQKQLKPVRLRLGITDGQQTELIEGDIEPGVELATNVNTGQEQIRAPAGFGFPPFMGPGGRGPGGPGGPGGGGNRGGGANRGGGGRG